MSTLATKFDEHFAEWCKEQSYPWQKLKYKQTAVNLAKHLPKQQLHILDAGGGNGTDSLPFAEQGHRVELVDYSKEMLADAHRQAVAVGSAAAVHCHQADLREIGQLFPHPRFDVVLCHNVLQYVEDVPALLRNLLSTLKPGGLLSLIGVNRFSRVYMAAFLRNDLAVALTQIDARTIQGILFDTPLTNYSAQEICTMLDTTVCQVEQDYGLLCLTSYWGDNERKYDPTIYAQLEELELALTDKHPYKLLATYYQIITRKQ
jgi:S-adenosylmethionine-dependent methyltransferase